MNYPPRPFTADLLEGIRLLAPSLARGWNAEGGHDMQWGGTAMLSTQPIPSSRGAGQDPSLLGGNLGRGGLLAVAIPHLALGRVSPTLQ